MDRNRYIGGWRKWARRRGRRWSPTGAGPISPNRKIYRVYPPAPPFRWRLTLPCIVRGCRPFRCAGIVLPDHEEGWRDEVGGSESARHRRWGDARQGRRSRAGCSRPSRNFRPASGRPERKTRGWRATAIVRRRAVASSEDRSEAGSRPDAASAAAGRRCGVRRLFPRERHGLPAAKA